MGKNIKKILVCLISILLLPSLFACSAGQEEVSLEDFLGAPVTIVFSSTQSIFARQELISKLNETITDIEDEISVENTNSDVYKFNQLDIGEAEVSETTYNLFNFCKEIYESTDGSFNIANYMLVDLWGFSSRHQKRDYRPTFAYDRERNSDKSFNLPEEKFVKAFMALADFSSIESRADGEKFYLIKNCRPQFIDGEKYTQKIDMSGIAKGYALDECHKLVKESGLSGTYISFGGSSLYLADNDGDTFELGIVNPFDTFRKFFAVTHVRDKFVSTSGTYENEYIVDGRQYHHIIDSKTGEPSNNDLVSATIIGLDGKYSDAYSTAVMVMGRSKAEEFLSSYGCTYVLVDKNKNVYTNSLDLNVYNLEFTLAND